MEAQGRCREAGSERSAEQTRETDEQELDQERRPTAPGASTTGHKRGPWRQDSGQSPRSLRLANSPALALALPNAYLASLGLPALFDGPA